MKTLGCKTTKNQVGMFVWGKVDPQYKDGYELCDELLYENNVFITPGGIFGSSGNQYIRISLCSSEETLINALENIKAKTKTGCRIENE